MTFNTVRFVGLNILLATANVFAAKPCYDGKFEVQIAKGVFAKYSFRLEAETSQDHAVFNSTVLNPDEVFTLKDGTKKSIKDYAHADVNLPLDEIKGIKCPCVAYATPATGQNFEFIVEGFGSGFRPRLTYFDVPASRVSVSEIEACKNLNVQAP